MGDCRVYSSVSLYYVWTHCLLLALLDVFPGTFASAHKWKIQTPGEKVDLKKMGWTMATCLFNQLFINAPLAYFMYTFSPIFRNMDMSAITLPSMDLLVFGIVEEIGFYYGHRFMHNHGFINGFISNIMSGLRVLGVLLFMRTLWNILLVIYSL